jgi:pyruvate dehydrogenase (quinone)
VTFGMRLPRLLHKDGPVVVDAVLDPFALALPSHVPFHTGKARIEHGEQMPNGRMDSIIRTMERNIRLV